MKRPVKHSAGFTILELMVAVSVLGILLGIGVPALGNLIRNNRIAEQANAVVGALNYARGETATRGVPVTICAARDAGRTQCDDAATNWANGWITFTDRTGTVGTLDGTDEVLQTGDAPNGAFTLSTTASFVRFGVGATPTTDRTFTIAPTNTSFCASTGQRQITVTRTGRVNTSKSTC